MPPLPSVPAVVRIKHTFTIGTDLTADSRMFFGYTGGPPTNADCAALANDCSTAFAAHCQSLMSDGTELTSIEVLDLSSPSAGVGRSTTILTGSRGIDLLSAGTAVLIGLPIARRYRGGKARIYWPFGVGSDLTTPNLWNTGSGTAFLNGFNNYQIAVGGLTSGTTVLTVLKQVSYYEGFTAVTNPITGRTKDVAKLRVGGPVVDSVVNVTLNPHPASQRRRNQTRI